MIKFIVITLICSNLAHFGAVDAKHLREGISESALEDNSTPRVLNKTSSSRDSRAPESVRGANHKETPLTDRNAKLVTSATQHSSPAVVAPPNPSPTNSSSALAGVRVKWRQFEKSLGVSLSRASSSLRSSLDELVANQTGDGLVSATCKSALVELLAGLADQELWAGQMLDASAVRLPSGLLEGSLTELGHFDECLAISSSTKSQQPTSQYCSLHIKPPLTNRPRLHTICRRLPNLSSVPALANQSTRSLVGFLSQNSHQFFYVGLRLGVCVPAKCSHSDVQLLLSSYLAKFELVGQVKNCQLAERSRAPYRADEQSGWLANYLAQLAHSSSLWQRLDVAQRCILLLFYLLFALVALGTRLDASHDAKGHQREGPAAAANLRETALGDVARPKCCQHYQVHPPTPAKDTCLSSKSALDLIYLAAHRSIDQDLGLGQQRNPLVDFVTTSLSSSPSTNLSSPSASSAPITRSNSPSTTAAQSNLLVNVASVSDEKLSSDLKSSVSCGRCNASSSMTSVPETHRRTTCTMAPMRRPQHSNGSLLRQFLVCFSVKSNLRTIGKQSTSADTDIKVIHGLRTLSMIWIIFGHTVGLVGPEMMNNLFSLAHLSCSSRILQALLNTTLAVDTFFMISGFVTLISFARKCKSVLGLVAPSSSLVGVAGHCGRPQLPPVKIMTASTHEATSRLTDIEVSSVSSTSSANTLISNSTNCKNCAHTCTSETTDGRWLPRDFKPLLWLLLRYLRLTPAYATIIGLSILLPALGSGPFWAETVGTLGHACRDNWLLNLSYLNNFLETDKLCLIHSWYLSNDWQFFALALLLFAVFYKSRKLTLLMLVSIFMASSAATFVSTVENDFPPTIVTTSPAIAERWTFIHSLYYKPWPHLPSYLVGLVTGYLILMDKLQPAGSSGLSAAGRLTCWLLFSLLGIAVLNSIYPWNMGIQVDPILTGLHSATFRTLWATCCGWLVYALVTKPRNSLALFLSWHGFQVTSRLTYCAYLVHPLIIYYHFGTLRERLDSSIYGQFNRFMSMLVQSYLSAFVLSLLVESPSIQLQRMVTKLYASKAGQKDEETKFQLHDLNQYWTKASTETTATRGATEHAQSSHQLPADSAHSTLVQNSTGGSSFTACAMHRRQEAMHDASVSPTSNSSNIDEEFQKRLAQAIGRGFKIRSKIVNGSLKHAQIRAVQARRLGVPAKRLPNQPRIESLPSFVASSDEQSTRISRPAGERMTSKLPAKPVTNVSRGGEQMSTFIAGCQQPRPQPSQPRHMMMLNQKLNEHQDSGALTQETQASAGRTPKNSGLRGALDLQEMIQIKQRLLSRT